MIRFHSVKWKNFLSTGNYFLEIQLDAQQNTLIVGANGSGKSTLLDALCFALFGKPFRKINKPCVVNSINQRDCLVELTFTTENHNYKIVRGINPNIFEIYRDNVLVDQDAAVGDYQDYLEKFILKFNFKSFTQIVILGSASFTPFMQLSSADRRSIIEDLLDIQIFSTMNNLVKERLLINRDHLTELKLKIESGKQKITMQESHINELQQNQEELLKGYQNELANNHAEIIRLEQSISTTSNTVEQLIKRIVGKDKITKSIKKFLQVEAQIENTLSKHKKHIEFFESNDSCPTCTQTIEKAFKQVKISTLGNKLQKCTEGLQTLNTKLSTQQKQLSTIESIEQTIGLHRTALVGWNTSIIELQKHQNKLNENIQLCQSRTGISTKEVEQLNSFKEEVKQLEQEYQQHIEDKSYLEAAATLLKDTGIKTKIIKQYLPIINSLCNKHLASLDFFVNFQLDETFKETIKSRHRDDFSYHSFSQGQKMRIDMSLMLTWRAVAKLKNSADTNLLILDEIFDSSLDANGADELMKMLQLLNGNNVFVISHRGDILQDKFMNTIRFAEQQHFARIIT